MDVNHHSQSVVFFHTRHSRHLACVKVVHGDLQAADIAQMDAQRTTT